MADGDTLDAQLNSGPLGQGNYKVQQGECLSSIARDRGFFWKTLWNHPSNTEIKTKRKDPNVLLPGDLLFIPQRTAKVQSCQTDKRHKFVLKGEPCSLKLTVMIHKKPRAGEPYLLTIDGKTTTGALDGNGTLEVPIASNAKGGTLVVGSPPFEEKFDLVLGAMDPVSNGQGVQKRLENLGFDFSETSIGETIAQFQKEFGLKVTGDFDDSTRKRLEQEHFSK
jgi:hypothetical protein